MERVQEPLLKSCLLKTSFKTSRLCSGFINVTRDGCEQVELEISFQEKL